MFLSGVMGSNGPGLVCPNYPASFVEGSGFSPTVPQNKVLSIGCVDSATLATLLTLSPPKGIAGAINLINSIISAAQALPDAFNVVSLDTATALDPGAGFFFSCGDDVLEYGNGFGKVNQSPIPCVGISIPMNQQDGTFAAQNLEFLGSCG